MSKKVAHECATSRKIYEKVGKPYKDLPMGSVAIMDTIYGRSLRSAPLL